MKIKTVICDVDGVLLDTVPYHFEAWEQLFNDEGIRFTYDDYLSKVNGLPRLTGIKNIMPSLEKAYIDKLAKRKQEYFMLKIEKIPPKPLAGVVSFFQKLREKKYNIAAASSSKN